MSRAASHGHDPSALLAGVAAFVTWGIVPAYWKLIKVVPAGQILAHRFVWTIIFLVLLMSWRATWPELTATFRNRRAALFCLGSGIFLSANWLLFIWAVNVDRVLETSLGYFMTPIVNVALGALILREHLTRAQLASIVLAAAGVAIRTIGYGHFPLIALMICLTFGLYGLLRKQSHTAPVPGLFLETTFLLPVAIAYLAWEMHRGALVFGSAQPFASAVLLTSGVVTAVPLIWFGHAARHLPLVTLGFLQYLSPSLSFLLGVFVYREPFTTPHLLGFLLIWTALAVVSTEAMLRRHFENRSDSEPAPLIEPGM